MYKVIRLLLPSLLLALLFACGPQEKFSEWPPITNEQKPWTRWWWQGSAVTREGITEELEAFAKAGLGGVEITPIYGVHGAEDKFVRYLSKEWVELLVHTLKEASRLGLGVDMATGTGWPFGGPWITDVYACKNLFYKTYTVNAGESLREKISFTQPPFLRAVGNQVYEVHDNAEAEGRVVVGTRKEPLQKYDAKNIRIEQLKQPVSANPELQSLALDQVQFERELPLVALIAYDESGSSVNIISSVGPDGILKWSAPSGTWKLYAVFQGWHGKMVERAAPGGEGNVIDHFSSEALAQYLAAFDSALSHVDLKSMRGFFNDSYEVDDARGAADWTPTLFEEFNKRRGYSLLEHLPELFGEGDAEHNDRILHDYRLTIGELLLDNFTSRWAQWAHDQGKIVRNQAHGAPANILDLYAAIDIPETEGVEPLRIKMATSAGHVTGKKLISSESATWLDEHFLSGLGDIKANVDRYMVNGVNHILYHGTNYSPSDEPWPGWLFYAAVHLNPRNPQWKDFAALNRYIARCQTLLQQGKASNDVLLYYPISDRYSSRGAEMVEHFDSPVNAFRGATFMTAADTLLSLGYAFDFISDKQLQQLQFENQQLRTTGDGMYKTVVIPACKYMPIETAKKLQSLIEAGASIIFYGGMPASPAGFADLKSNQETFSKFLHQHTRPEGSDNTNLAAMLAASGVNAEPMVSKGLKFTRRTLENGNVLYFIVNESVNVFNDWLPLKQKATTVVVRDPMTGRIGKAVANTTADGSSVFIRIQPGQSFILELSDNSIDLPAYQVATPGETVLNIDKGWTLEFISGGPVLPSSKNIDSLTAWTSLPDDELTRFSGTAVYSASFAKPVGTGNSWILSLGSISGTATVLINGDSLATLIGSPYEVWLDASQLKDTNVLKVQVSNLMANRIADMDRQGIQWKKFYNVNFPARKPENRRNGILYSGEWQPLKSGLEGPVKIAAAKPPKGVN